jgi:hypothetical protein
MTRRLPHAAVLLLPFVLAACSSTTTPTPPTPAEILRVWDANSNHDTTGTGADYQAAFDQVTPKCTQTAAQLPAMVEATHKILTDGGVTDETGLTVLQHLGDSIPAGSGPQDCVQLLAAYATLRTG